MDRYTKFILTVIAVGIIGINLKIYDVSFINNANAVTHNYHTHTTRDLTLFKSDVIDIITSCKVYKWKPDDDLSVTRPGLIGFCNR